VHLLHVLRVEGHISRPQTLIAPAIQDELERFDVYLDSVCGFAPATRTSRRRWVGRVLVDHFSSNPIDIDQLQPADIVEFMVQLANHYRPGTLHVLGGSLRSYLRFRAVSRGDKVETLLAAVPCAAEWRLDTVPTHLTPEEVVRFLGAFDQNSASGRRDYAMARCLLDMGLRAGEVAAIQLEDLNWREATLTISHGKSRRADVLPLPALTGKVIVQYLRRARPRAPRGSCSSAIAHHSRPPLPQSSFGARSAGLSAAAA
jgi:integrase/recombinase XerD